MPFCAYTIVKVWGHFPPAWNVLCYYLLGWTLDISQLSIASLVLPKLFLKPSNRTKCSIFHVPVIPITTGNDGKDMGIPDHLTCLLRNLYAGQEATNRTGHGTTDWFQIGKGVYQGCVSSPCLFHFFAEYIMRNTGLEEAQAGIKIAGRNINNLRYADDTTLMAESDEELKSLWWKWKRRVKRLA